MLVYQRVSAKKTPEKNDQMKAPGMPASTHSERPVSRGNGAIIPSGKQRLEQSHMGMDQYLYIPFLGG
jgi:hypothetical protein